MDFSLLPAALLIRNKNTCTNLAKSGLSKRIRHIIGILGGVLYDESGKRSMCRVLTEHRGITPVLQRSVSGAATIMLSVNSSIDSLIIPDRADEGENTFDHYE